MNRVTASMFGALKAALDDSQFEVGDVVDLENATAILIEGGTYCYEVQVGRDESVKLVATSMSVPDFRREHPMDPASVESMAQSSLNVFILWNTMREPDDYDAMDDEKLRDEVVSDRVGCCFNDGQNEEIARDHNYIGKPVAEMSRAELLAELRGEVLECDHEHSHINDHGDGQRYCQRYCNDCKTFFTPVDYGGRNLERWQLADSITYLFGDGRSQEFNAQVWEMLDTRTVEQLRILAGKMPTATINETKGDES